MSRTLKLLLLSACAGAVLATGAMAQDFPDVQRFTNKVLFAKEDAARRQRAAEQRRVDELDRRAREQAALLEQQAASVRQLDGELQSIRDERRLMDLVASFEAAIAAGRPPLARALLADSVTVDMAGASAAGGVPIAADSAVAALAALGAKGVSPRSNTRVTIEGERATLVSDGYAWGHADRVGKVMDRYAGEFSYGFQRTSDGWKIDAVMFRPSAPM